MIPLKGDYSQARHGSAARASTASPAFACPSKFPIPTQAPARIVLWQRAAGPGARGTLIAGVLPRIFSSTTSTSRARTMAVAVAADVRASMPRAARARDRRPGDQGCAASARIERRDRARRVRLAVHHRRRRAFWGTGPARQVERWLATGGSVSEHGRIHALLLRAIRQRLQGGAGAAARRRRLGAALRRLFRRRDAHGRVSARSTSWARCRCSSIAALALSQSGVILDYLAETLGALRRRRCRRAPRDPALAALGQPQADQLHGDLRFMRTFVEKPDPAVLAEFCASAPRRRGACSTRISRARRYVVGERLTIADLSLCGYLFWPRGDRRRLGSVSEHRATGSRAITARSRAGCIPTS